MNHKNSLEASRNRELVNDNMFDEHMAAARIMDIESRKSTFDRQTARTVERLEAHGSIQSSTY